MQFIKALSQIPTSCLIEDYQGLLSIKRGMQDGTMEYNDIMENLSVIIDCLASTISSCTPTAAFAVGDDIRELFVSPASIIDATQEEGVLVYDDGSEVLCAAGKPVSECMAGECGQCSFECMVEHDCNPEDGITTLEGGFQYVRGDGASEEKLHRYLGECQRRKNTGERLEEITV